MFHSQRIAARQRTSADKSTTGPITGIALALPLSLVIWAVLFEAMRIAF